MAQVDEFCEKYNGIVICDYPSGYNGKYRIVPNLVTKQATSGRFRNIDFMIDIGEVSGIYASLKPRTVWRVAEDGDVKDTFKKLVKVFETDVLSFFKKMNEARTERIEMTYYKMWRKKFDELSSKLSEIELPFSNPWIARQLAPMLKDGDKVHLAILNTLRSWDLCEVKANVDFYSNTGGFGIDGIMSTALGNSLITKNTVYCLIGDLAFFYDLNSIGNKNLGNNFRVLLVNNGCGTEFHNFDHRAASIAKENDLSLEYFAADGHYGNQSKTLVKHYAEDLGFKYLTASNKKEFMENLTHFVDKKSKRPILFEVFTTPAD